MVYFQDILLSILPHLTFKDYTSVERLSNNIRCVLLNYRHHHIIDIYDTVLHTMLVSWNSAIYHHIDMIVRIGQLYGSNIPQCYHKLLLNNTTALRSVYKIQDILNLFVMYDHLILHPNVMISYVIVAGIFPRKDTVDNYQGYNKYYTYLHNHMSACIDIYLKTMILSVKYAKISHIHIYDIINDVNTYCCNILNDKISNEDTISFVYTLSQIFLLVTDGECSILKNNVDVDCRMIEICSLIDRLYTRLGSGIRYNDIPRLPYLLEHTISLLPRNISIEICSRCIIEIGSHIVSQQIDTMKKLSSVIMYLLIMTISRYSLSIWIQIVKNMIEHIGIDLYYNISKKIQKAKNNDQLSCDLRYVITLVETSLRQFILHERPSILLPVAKRQRLL